jgi:putative endonuclease
MKYYTYVLECADKTLYVGYTTDIEKRLVAHNTLKTGAHYTKIRRPVQLVYSEEFNTLSEALKREHEIKSWSRQKKIDLIQKNTVQ